jgi:hypothetical protein
MLLALANGRVPGLLAAQSYRALWSVVYRNMSSQLTASMGRKNAQKYLRVHDKQGECYLEWNGAPIFLRSATHPAGMDGLNVGWVAGDELRHWPHASWVVSQSRARIPCPRSERVYATTPTVGWIADEYNTGKDNRQLIVAPTLENAPNLAPGFIENLRQSFSTRLQKAVIDGWFVPMEGAVYEALDPDVYNSEHAVDFNPAAKPNAKHYLAIDPGYRRSAWIWIQQTGPTEWVVFDEIMPDDTSDQRCVEMVNARGWPIDEIWIDPAGDNVQSAFGVDTFSILAGIKTRRPDPICTIGGRMREIAWGVERVRSLLDWGGLGRKYPRLRFAKRLEAIERGSRRGIVKDMLAYTYPEPTPGIARKLDKPVKDSICDHSNDAARYWAVGMWMTNPVLQQQLAAVEKMLDAA